MFTPLELYIENSPPPTVADKQRATLWDHLRQRCGSHGWAYWLSTLSAEELRIIDPHSEETLMHVLCACEPLRGDPQSQLRFARLLVAAGTPLAQLRRGSPWLNALHLALQNGHVDLVIYLAQQQTKLNRFWLPGDARGVRFDLEHPTMEWLLARRHKLNVSNETFGSLAAWIMRSGPPGRPRKMSKSEVTLFDKLRRDAQAAVSKCRLLWGIFALRRSVVLPPKVGFYLVRICHWMRYHDLRTRIHLGASGASSASSAATMGE